MTVCACLVVANRSALSTSPRTVPLKRSLYPFSPGDPGYMLIGLIPTLFSLPLKGSDVTSGPLSERRYSGFPHLSSYG